MIICSDCEHEIFPHELGVDDMYTLDEDCRTNCCWAFTIDTEAEE